MGQILLLKVDSTYGIPLEFDKANDEITLKSYTVDGVNGPVLSITGLDLLSQNISNSGDITFDDSSTATITVNSTAFVADNMMFETKENNMTTAGAVLFPVVTDVAGEVDAFRLPALAGTPSATPADGGEGYLVWDSTGNKMYAWNGSSWDDLSSVASANTIDDSYVAGENLAVTEAVYISGSNTVSKADAGTASKSLLMGFATETKTSTNPVIVRKIGKLAGFTGLTPGARYFLDSTAGAITTTVPTGTGNVIVQAGYGVTTAILDIAINQLGRRAV